MNINRNNYETFFLLYIDNELSATEKNVVEAFIAENADLQEELQMLKLSVIKPAAVQFPDKNRLRKKGAANIVSDERLLLLLDNELPAQEKQELFFELENNDCAKTAWAELLQTRLPGDAVIFENKNALYRKERDRVMYIRWWQIAAAAMLIGFGLWGTVSYFNPATSAGSTAEKAVVSNSVQFNSGSKVISGNEQVKNPGIADALPNDYKQPSSVRPMADKAINTNNSTLIAVADDPQIPLAVSSISKQPAADSGTGSGNQTLTISVSQPTAPEAPKSIAPSPFQQPDSAILNTMYAINEEAVNYNRFDDDGEGETKKPKLGGFFKRLKRVIERKTKIKTGNSDEVKIANMAFAIQ